MEDYMVEEEEEDNDYYEEDKFDQMMNDLCDYCNYYQIPLLSHDDTNTVFKELLHLQF